MFWIKIWIQIWIKILFFGAECQKCQGDATVLISKFLKRIIQILYILKVYVCVCVCVCVCVMICIIII